MSARQELDVFKEALNAFAKAGNDLEQAHAGLVRASRNIYMRDDLEAVGRKLQDIIEDTEAVFRSVSYNLDNWEEVVGKEERENG